MLPLDATSTARVELYLELSLDALSAALAEIDPPAPLHRSMEGIYTSISLSIGELSSIPSLEEMELDIAEIEVRLERAILDALLDRDRAEIAIEGALDALRSIHSASGELEGMRERASRRERISRLYPLLHRAASYLEESSRSLDAILELDGASTFRERIYHALDLLEGELELEGSPSMRIPRLDILELALEAAREAEERLSPLRIDGEGTVALEELLEALRSIEGAASTLRELSA